jgi:hypothetical protein
MLLFHGADPDAVTNKKKTPLDIAAENSLAGPAMAIKREKGTSLSLSLSLSPVQHFSKSVFFFFGSIERLVGRFRTVEALTDI